MKEIKNCDLFPDKQGMYYLSALLLNNDTQPNFW